MKFSSKEIIPFYVSNMNEAFEYCFNIDMILYKGNEASRVIREIDYRSSYANNLI